MSISPWRYLCELSNKLRHSFPSLQAHHGSGEQSKSQLQLAGKIFSQVATAAGCPALGSQQVHSVLESNVTVGESTLTVIVEEVLSEVSINSSYESLKSESS